MTQFTQTAVIILSLTGQLEQGSSFGFTPFIELLGRKRVSSALPVTQNDPSDTHCKALKTKTSLLVLSMPVWLDNHHLLSLPCQSIT